MTTSQTREEKTKWR